MDYTQIVFYLTIFAAGVVVLIALTNILTQLIKKLINREKFPVQVLTLIIAEILTIVCLVALCQILALPIFWYYIVLAFIVGAVVAYAAIFGYDNLYSELMAALKNLLAAIFGKEGVGGK